MAWATKKGLYRRLPPGSDFAEHMVQLMDAHNALEEMARGDTQNHQIRIEMPRDQPKGIVIAFYSNYTRPRARLSEEREKAVVQLLRRELDLPPHEAQPKWYYVNSPPDFQYV